MKTTAAIALILMLAACGGRAEPHGTVSDPVCMKDGSVTFVQLPADNGKYGEPMAKAEYCPWYKKP